MAESSLQEGMLLVDAGNSYLKLTHCNAEGVLGASRKIHENDIGLSLFEDHPFKHCVLLPGAERAAHRWRALCQQNAEVSLRIIGEDIPAPDLGQYATCGLDRICAGIGAVALLDADQEGVVVLDCGTATTVSAWAKREGSPPLFKGGLILPGAQSCMSGLCAAAPALPQNLPAVLEPERVNALAHGTASAMQQAVTIGYPAMARACLDAVQSAAGFDGVLLTGGGLSSLGARNSWPLAWREEQQLTALGMFHLARLCC